MFTSNRPRGDIMKKLKVVGVATGLAAILAVGSPLAASAGLVYHSYDLTIYKLGGWDYSANQNKVTSSKAGDLRVDFVGNGYSIGASMLRGAMTQEGTKRYNLSAGTWTTLPNGISAGYDVNLKVWGNPIWPVNIQTTGIWRSN